MSVLVAYVPGMSGRGALALAAALASARGDTVDLVHVAVRTWPSSPGHGDGEFRRWIVRSAREAIDQGVAELAELAPELTVRSHLLENRSVPTAIERAAADLSACAVVVGSGPQGTLGQVVLGATANRIAHSSAVPVLVAPRGYRLTELARLVAAWSGADDPGLLREMVAFGRQAGIPTTAVTFGRRRDVMYPSGAGLDAEEAVMTAWREQAQVSLVAAAAAAGIDGDATTVAVGPEWSSTVDAFEWAPGDLLAVGSHAVGTTRRVFLGSTATKIIRHSPVPVVVLPG